jgi:hypothetical protein
MQLRIGLDNKSAKTQRFRLPAKHCGAKAESYFDPRLFEKDKNEKNGCIIFQRLLSENFNSNLAMCKEVQDQNIYDYIRLIRK